MKFTSKWMLSHIEDGNKVLKKPVMFTEFGLSDQNKGFLTSQRDRLYETVGNIIYNSAKAEGSGAGAMVWQYLVEGMVAYSDDFGVVPWERAATHRLIIQQSCRLGKLQGLNQQDADFRRLCSAVR